MLRGAISRLRKERCVPRMLPANAVIPQIHPCRLEDAIPLKYAPILHPYAMRAPYPRRSRRGRLPARCQRLRPVPACSAGSRQGGR